MTEKEIIEKQYKFNNFSLKEENKGWVNERMGEKGGEKIPSQVYYIQRIVLQKCYVLFHIS